MKHNFADISIQKLSAIKILCSKDEYTVFLRIRFVNPVEERAGEKQGTFSKVKAFSPTLLAMWEVTVNLIGC